MHRALHAASRLLIASMMAANVCAAAFAAAPAIAPEVPPLPPPQLAARPAANPVQSQSAANLFSRPVLLRGTLGASKIQMRLQPHVEFEGSVQGEYFAFGQSQKIALAGEYQGDELTMEESVNGTNVSGQWSGSLIGKTYSGNWYAEDESSSVPFTLTVSEPIAKR